MMGKSLRASLATLVFIAALGGCATAPPGSRVYVRVAPPPARVEAVSPAPGPQYVWVRGHWRWAPREASYRWVPGHWLRLQPGYRTWVPGHWARDRRGWFWVEGHWRR